MQIERHEEGRFGSSDAAPENASVPPGTRVEEDPRFEAVETRQGGPGRAILYVLIAALILGAIYVLGTTFWASKDAPKAGGQIAPTTQTEPTPPPPGGGQPQSPSGTPALAR